MSSHPSDVMISDDAKIEKVPSIVSEFQGLLQQAKQLQSQLKVLRQQIKQQQTNPQLLQWFKEQHQQQKEQSLEKEIKRVPKGTKGIVQMNNVKIFVIERPKYDKLTKEMKRQRLIECLTKYIPDLLRHSYEDYLYERTEVSGEQSLDEVRPMAKHVHSFFQWLCQSIKSTPFLEQHCDMILSEMYQKQIARRSDADTSQSSASIHESILYRF